MNRNPRSAANSTGLPLIVQSSRRFCNSPDCLEFPDFLVRPEVRPQLEAGCIRTARRSASASSYMSLRTSRMPEEGFKVHRFAAVLPKQRLTKARRHCDAVVPADQRAVVMRCLGDDLAALVHDVSHSRKPCQDRLLPFTDQLAVFMSVPIPATVRSRSSLLSGGCALLNNDIRPWQPSGTVPATNIRNISSS
jgi:hypothetical protein